MHVESRQGGYDAPYLYLGGTRGGDGLSGLPAILKNASSEIISDEITFTYTVEPGDTIAGASLEVESPYALRGGTVPLVDLLMREINVTLPIIGSKRSLSYTSTMSVDSAVPVVTAISSSLEGGEYGIGQVRPMCRHVPINLLCRSINRRKPPERIRGMFHDFVLCSACVPCRYRCQVNLRTMVHKERNFLVHRENRARFKSIPYIIYNFFLIVIL